ncbi:MAG TPA: phosphoglycerate kinase, partial [Leptospiraceae bacterium]|nr:phosphoglycerate kinase [Leptospiraceae bacterium]
MQRIETLSVSNQKVFVRADLSGLGDPPSGKALSRILPVVEILLGKQAGVVLAGHDSNQNTFAPLADAIGKSLGRPVHLVEPGDMKQRWSTLKAGQVILL